MASFCSFVWPTCRGPVPRRGWVGEKTTWVRMRENESWERPIGKTGKEKQGIYASTWRKQRRVRVSHAVVTSRHISTCKTTVHSTHPSIVYLPKRHYQYTFICINVSHQYLLIAANVFWAVGFTIANGVLLPHHILLYTAYLTYFKLPYPRLHGVLSPNTPVVHPLPFVPDHKKWDGTLLVHWLYSFVLCVSRCRFWRARGSLWGKARIRSLRLLELCTTQ